MFSIKFWERTKTKSKLQIPSEAMFLPPASKRLIRKYGKKLKMAKQENKQENSSTFCLKFFRNGRRTGKKPGKKLKIISRKKHKE